MKTLKLEVGKTYRNRKGEEVRIVEKSDISFIRYPYKGNDDEWYSSDGRFDYVAGKSFRDLIEEVEEAPETRHTFPIPDGVKEITLDYFGNRIVVEMVPEKDPKPGDVPESTRIREWVEEHLNDGYYNQQGIAEVIGHYLKHKEGKNETNR